MNRFPLTVAGMLVTLSALSAGSAARAHAAEHTATGPWCILAESGKLAVVSEERDSQTSCRWQCVVHDGRSLTPASSFVLCKVGALLGPGQTIRALRPSPNTMVVIANHEGGATSSLKYAVFRDSGLGSETVPTMAKTERIDEIRYGKDEYEEVIDLRFPDLAVYQGESYVVAEGRIRERTYGSYVRTVACVAPLKPATPTPTGWIVADGERPHIVQQNDRFVVAVQITQPNTDLAWGKIVKVHESTDLQSWKPMAAPDPALEFYDYELTVAKGQLTLVGVVDVSERDKRPERGAREEYRPPLALVVLTYDPDKGAWQTVSKQRDASLTRMSEVKLIPPAVTGGALKLLRRESENRLTTTTLAE